MGHEVDTLATVAFGRTLLRRRAFTMIEAVIVIVLIGIMASVVGVRFTDSLDRRVEVSIRQLEAVLGSLAHRQTVGQGHLALLVEQDKRDENRVCVRLEVLSQWDDEEEPTWKPDLMSRPAWFDEDIKLTGVYVDAVEMRGSFRLPIPHDEPRPAISVEITYGERGQIIELLPHDLRPHRLIQMTSSVPDSANLLPIDLDDEGLSEEAWDW